MPDRSAADAGTAPLPDSAGVARWEHYGWENKPGGLYQRPEEHPRGGRFLARQCGCPSGGNSRGTAARCGGRAFHVIDAATVAEVEQTLRALQEDVRGEFVRDAEDRWRSYVAGNPAANGRGV